MGLTDDNSMFPRGACDPKWRGRAEKAEARVDELEHSLADAMEQLAAVQGTNQVHIDRVRKLEAYIRKLRRFERIKDDALESSAAKTSQAPRPMSEAPRDTREIAMLVRVAFRAWDSHGAHGFVSRDGRKYMHENDLGLDLNGRPLHDECILGWLPLPDREESKAEPGNQPEREDESDD